MSMFEIINKSQAKQSLTQEDIEYLVKGFTLGDLPDYQVSAWLATVFLNPLNDEETSFLTQALCNSGKKLTWDSPTVDKHSTGGVGDKTSLIIGPLVASLGYKIPMMAGRGLGHTGGTIDKLESLNLKTSLSSEEFKSQVEKNSLCIIGQSEDFCPADKKMYALRDATQTVANIPLICASIMSKKIAEGLSGLVLDVKFGTGAFMQTMMDATDLAQKLINTGESSGIKTYGVLSSMNQPLGRFIGNKLEMLECHEIVSKPEENLEKYNDTFLLSVLLSALMIKTIEPQKSLERLFDLCLNQLLSGKVDLFFTKFIQNQGGDLSLLKTDSKIKTVYASQDGYMNYTNVKNLGFAAVELGAGRFKKEDQIDFDVGFYCHKKQYDVVKKSEPLFDIYYNEDSKLENSIKRLQKSYELSADQAKVAKPKLVDKIIELSDKKFKDLSLNSELLKI